MEIRRFKQHMKKCTQPTLAWSIPPSSPHCRRLERCCTWKILTIDKTLEGFPPGRCHMLTPFKGTFEDDIMISSYSPGGICIRSMQAYFLACAFLLRGECQHLFFTNQKSLSISPEMSGENLTQKQRSCW